MDIINKKFSESKRFKPGYNIALGRSYSSASEMVSDMNKRGFEPYDKNQKEKVRESYKPSKECHEKIEYIRKHTDRKTGKVQLSGKMREELRPYLPK